MSQNTQQYPRTGTDLQSLPAARNDDPLAQVDTLKIVACSVCRAVYVPANEQYTQDSATLLETAFLGVCRFCFRCQRPACPQCWNPVHHACASCSEEARLPFRSPVPSLEGLILLSTSSAHAAQKNKVSFLCQRNGRFYTPESAPSRPESQEVSTPSAPIACASTTSDALPALQPERTNLAPASAEAYPTWLQEVFGQKTDHSSAPASEGKPWGNTANMYPPVEPAIVWSRANQTNGSQMAPTVQQQAAPVISPVLPAPIMQPIPSVAASQIEATPQEDEVIEDISLLERIENVLIVITSILLLAVVSMIVLSISSIQVNTFILNLLHIDIRTEIAYLLQLR